MSSETPHSVPTAGLLPPTWVDRQTSFEKMVADLSAHSRVAVDTESNSLHAYREQVCLIQDVIGVRGRKLDQADLLAVGLQTVRVGIHGDTRMS